MKAKVVHLFVFHIFKKNLILMHVEERDIFGNCKNIDVVACEIEQRQIING